MRTFAFWAAQAALLWIGHANLQSFAVVRPFATVDTLQIPSSFDSWNAYLPCQAGTATPVDLLLCFSQDVATNADALYATQQVVDQFLASKSNTSSWHHCFRSVKVVSALLSPQDDVYQPLQSMVNPDWVRGPNMQFLRMAQAFEQKAWGDYSAWYLMEMDSVPRLGGWLESLLTEVEARSPIGVLGSFYRGDSWDKLTLPEEIRIHINGNAVYNSSNPLLQSFTVQLAGEMANNTVTPAFDVLLARHYLAQELEEAEFAWFDGNSSVIGNYAHTAMIESYYNGEAVVHGGITYQAWEEQTEAVTLVVSDFGLLDETAQPAFASFKQKLLDGHHQFREVIVMRPSTDASAATTATTNGANGPETVLFKEVSRAETAWLDWCNAPVTSPWFMYTNTFFDFGRRCDLPRDRKTSSPVITYVDAASSFCTDYVSCTSSLLHASEFSGHLLNKHVDTHQMIFHTASRDAFCTEWKGWWNVRRMGPNQKTDPVYGPTGDDFLAFMHKHNKTHHYSLKDSREHGRRNCGVVNGTLCETLPNRTACRSVIGCAWHPKFETCFHGRLPENVKPPPFRVGPPEWLIGCLPDVVRPKFPIHSLDGSAFDLDVEFTGAVQSLPSPVSLTGTTPTVIDVQGSIVAAAVDDVLPTTMVLKTKNLFPRLVRSVPVEVFDLQSWNVKANYVGSTMTISTNLTSTVLLADQPVKSATATELVLDASTLLKQGTTLVNVEQNGNRGVANTHLRKCYNVDVAVITPSPTSTATSTQTATPTRRPKLRTLSATPTMTSTATVTSTTTATPTKAQLPSVAPSSPKPSDAPSASPQGSPTANASPQPSSSPIAPNASPIPSQSGKAAQSPKASGSRSPVAKVLSKKSPSRSPSASRQAAQPQASPKPSASPVAVTQASPKPSASPVAVIQASPKPVIQASPKPSASPVAVPQASPKASASPAPAVPSPRVANPSPQASSSPSPTRKRGSGKELDDIMEGTAIEVSSEAASSAPWIIAGVVIPVALVLAIVGWLGVRHHRRTSKLMRELEVKDVSDPGLPDPNCTPIAISIFPDSISLPDVSHEGGETTARVTPTPVGL